jgi:hypothetical protein
MRRWGLGFLFALVAGSAWAATVYVSDQVVRGTASAGLGLESSPTGEAFAMGYWIAPTGDTHWLLRKAGLGASRDQWNDVDDFQLVPGKDAQAFSTAFDRAGNIFVSGSARDASGVRNWIVRKSSDQGQTWATVDQLATAASQGPFSILAASDGTIYAAGYQIVKSGTVTKTHWLVRKSADVGATWATVDDLTADQSSFNASTMLEYAGAIYVLGQGYGLAGESTDGRMMIRKSSDSGASWTTVLEQPSEDPSAYCQATSAAADVATGAVYLAGYCNHRGLVKKSTDGMLTWQTVEEYYPQPKNGYFNPIRVAPDGTVYVGGFAYTGDGANKDAIVMVSSDQGANWSVVYSNPGTSVGDAGIEALALDGASRDQLVFGGTEPNASGDYWTIHRQ